MERHDGETTSEFDKIGSATDVRDNALAIIDRLNGAVALSTNANPVRFGGIVQFAPDGKKHRTMFAETAVFVQSFIDANAFVIGPDGQPVPSPPQPSEAQRWFEKANTDSWLEDALIYFGKGGNWFDIYKTIECLEMRAGGVREFQDLNWEPKADVQLLKQTANWARHARRKLPPPPNPMPLQKAQELLRRLLRRALS